MYGKLLWNDLKNNIIPTLNIALFIMLSTAFLATAGQLSAELLISMNQLFEKAQTPHLLQMHTGELDRDRLGRFVKTREEIDKYQVLEFWNVDNSYLSVNGNSWKDSVYDNGFSVQSREFDFLFDLNNALITPKQGEVYVPLYYFTSGAAKEGDTLEINIGNAGGFSGDGKLKLTISGFVRDSQMNSSLSVSRRFIVHESDLRTISQVGDLEYLIEFRLHDANDIAEVETAYNENGLEANGPPFMSISLFRIVNAFSDGISIMALLLISILVIAICMLCIRLTMLSKLEEDEKEIAVLRAIGIEFKEIKNIFLTKYIFIAALSALLGFGLSFLLKIPFLVNMKMFFGENRFQWQSAIAAMTLTMAVFGLLIAFMNKTAGKIKKIMPIKRENTEKDVLLRFPPHFPMCLKLAIGDLSARWKIYKNMVIVFILTVFVITVPMSMYRTISDSGFIRYLGLGNYDVRIDLTQIDGKEREVEAFLNRISGDENIRHFEVYTGKQMEMVTDSGNREKIWIDLGEQKEFGAQYIAGNAPGSANEIALSKLKANDLEKKVGDEICVLIEEVPTALRISGIYSDLTNGGKTARGVFQADSSKTIWKIIPIRLKDSGYVEEWIRQYQEEFPFAKFSDVQAYTRQIFGNTVQMTGRISDAAFIASTVLVFLITFLFMHMLYLKDLSQNALLKSVGFTNRYIFGQYLMKSSIMLWIGLLLGFLLAFTAGERLGSWILELIGVSGVQFIRGRNAALVMTPLFLWATTLLGTVSGVMKIRRMNVSQQIKEDL